MVRRLRKNRGGTIKVKKHGLGLSLLRASVKEANKYPDLFKNLSKLKSYKSEVTGNCFNLSCVTYCDCPQDLFAWMMNLLDRNVAELYATCDWGWNLDQKRKEMSEKEARFIIAYSEQDEPVAFTHFRFDMDYNASVVYCYEIQVDKVAQKQGLAKHIMRILESLCQEHNMMKVVLTVFKHNENACRFFASQGYKPDETSPENHGIKDTCYVILSKPKLNDDCFASQFK